MTRRVGDVVVERIGSIACYHLSNDYTVGVDITELRAAEWSFIALAQELR